MRRPVLVATMLILAACGGSAYAADAGNGLAPSPDALAANVAPVGSLRVTTATNANVRYTPNAPEGKVIVTLPKGAEVEILGPAKVADWYVIRFPREGKAWVHSKVLQSVDGGKRWRVTEDRSRARDDSTLRSEIVAELNKGEILEDMGRLNGEWRAVYLPNAVAYIHKSVLNLPTDMHAAIVASSEKARHADGIWSDAQTVYASYYAALQKNPQNALVLDWEGLAKQFDIVIHDHADADVRVSAQRLKDGIINVAAAAVNLQKAKGIAPVKSTGDMPVPVVVADNGQALPGQALPAIGKPATQTGPLVDPLTPERLTVPQAEVTPLPPEAVKPLPPVEAVPAGATPTQLAVPTPPVASKKVAAQGFVTQQNFDQLGVTDVLVDGDGNVVALLKPKVGVDLQFSSYIMRWVGVYGEVQQVERAKHGLNHDLPLIIVDDLTLNPR